MKNSIKLLLSIAALTFSTNAYAMPEQVSANWWDNMMQRLEVMANNPGFCRGVPYVPICRR